MKKLKIIGLGIVLIILLSNIPILRVLRGWGDCSFSNSNGDFTFTEMSFGEYDYQTCQARFREFKMTHSKDTVLYRLCSENILHFWDYGQYLFSEKYRLPYKPWDEINKKRGPIENKSGFQDF